MAQPDPLRAQLSVVRSTDREMARILERTAKQLRALIMRQGSGIGGEVRAAQLRVTLGEIRKIQRTLWRTGVLGAVTDGVDSAVEAAENAVEALTRVAYNALPEAVAQALVDGLRASALSGLKSDKARRIRALSPRVYKLEALHTGKIEDIIRTGLIGNLSARELASDVYQYVSPTTKGGASYAAMRLARTEINNAFHERQRSGAERPGVRAAKWNLSGSHRVPDLCNKYATHGGKGEWKPNEIPDKPHPQCFCYLTYVTMAPKDFRRAMARGDFNDEIDRRTRANIERLKK